MDMVRRHGWRWAKEKVNVYWVVAVLFSCLWAVVVLWPHLTDWYRVPIDAQNFYWMAKFQNPALFPDDPLQFTDRLISIYPGGIHVLLYPASLGYTFIFYLASYVVSPIIFSKILVFFLLPISVHYLYRFGEKLSGKRTGLLMGILFSFLMMASPDSISIASGLQRSFAFPIVMAFLYYLHKGDTLSASVFLPLSVLIYLPVFPLLFVTYGLYIVDFSQGVLSIRIQIDEKQLLTFAIAAGVSLAITGWALYHHFNLSSSLGLAQIQKDVPIRQNPLNQEGGPVPMYLRFPWLGKAGLFDVDADALTALIMGGVGVLTWMVIRRKDRIPLPAIVWKMVLAGVLLYGLSLVAVFGFSTTVFYLPSRYSRTVLVAAPFLYAASNYGVLAERLPIWVRKNRSPFILGLSLIFLMLTAYGYFVDSFHILIGWLGLLLVGLFAYLLPGVSYSLLVRGWRQKNQNKIEILILVLLMGISLAPLFYFSRLVGYNTIDPEKHDRALYQYAASLPEDAMLAGSPDELTGIPLFSKRNVLFRSLFPDQSAPIVENFDAYYAESPTTILRFCNQYGVDFLVYNERDYNQTYLQENEFFFKPYNLEIIDIVKNRTQFVLPNAKVTFHSGPVAVVECEEGSFRGAE